MAVRADEVIIVDMIIKAERYYAYKVRDAEMRLSLFFCVLASIHEAFKSITTFITNDFLPNVTIFS